MKKIVKYGILLILVAVGAVAFVLNAIQPLAVEAILIEPAHARAYFTERGYVREDGKVDVFALVEGKILSVNVKEGQAVTERDALAVVDSSELYHEIEKIKINNTAILAQITELSAEEARARNELIDRRNSLQGELDANYAQEQIAQESENWQQQVKEENIRLQNIIIEQNRAEMYLVEDDLARMQTLFSAGAISVTEFKAAEQALESQKNALETNIQRLEIIVNESNTSDQTEYFKALRSSIQAQINGIDRTLSSGQIEPMQQYYRALIESGNHTIIDLERKISDSTIRSPVSGVITKLHLDSTNVVSITLPIAEIRTETKRLIEVFISTSNIDDIHIGDTVDLILSRQENDLIYSGTVYAIKDSAESMTSVLGVEERRVEVLIEPNVANGDAFKRGFDVDVRFTTYYSENQIVVPRTAVLADDDKSTLFVIKDGIAVATPVQLGRTLRTEVVVESGLSFGDVVIRNAQQGRLSDGINVASINQSF